MSIRLFILFTLALGVIVYAQREWYIGLLGLILLSAIMNHPDMPRQWFGIVGINLWNIMFLAVLVPWYQQRGNKLGGWDAPIWAKRLYGSFVVITVIAVLRSIADQSSFRSQTFGYTWVGLTYDYILNAMKYTAPGLLLFDGARTRKRITCALIAAMVVPLVYGIIISRHIGPGALSLPYKQQLKVRRHVGKTIGFHANTCSQVMAASVWGALALGALYRRFLWRLAILGHACYIGWGLLLCLSRAGYWGATGIGAVFAMFFWRGLLLLLPLGISAIWIFVPAVPQRILSGFNMVDEVTGQVTTDLDTVTAGRTILWPMIVEAIYKNPVFGYGRLGIQRCDEYDQIQELIGAVPEHPHNAYLELLLDTGLVGTIPILAMYGGILYCGFSLAKDLRDPLYRTTGLVAVAAVLAVLIMGISGQSMFPKEASQVAWCTYGLAVRVWVERQRSDHRRSEFQRWQLWRKKRARHMAALAEQGGVAPA